MSLYSYEDGVQHALDYIGADQGDQVMRDCKRAVINAVHDLESAHTWSYLYTSGRVMLDAAFGDGTADFVCTGGSSLDLVQRDRLWTLSGAPVLPAWVGQGASVLVGNVVYRISQRVSDTEFTTDPHLSPSVDLVNLSYCVFQDLYLLPPDFAATNQLFREKPLCGMDYINPSDHLEYVRRGPWIGNPRFYSIVGANFLEPGRMCLAVYPAPIEAKTVDFVYKRRCASLDVYRYSQGAVGVSPFSGVVGQGTAWAADMAGCVLRLSRDRSALPTAAIGSNPPAWEALVTEVLAPNQLKVFAPGSLPVLAATQYTLSSVIDIEQAAMMTALQRGIELQVSLARVVKDRPSAKGLYVDALRGAKAADSRSFAGRVVGDSGVPVRRAGGVIQYVRGGADSGGN